MIRSEERHNFLLNTAREHGFVSVSQAAARLKVSAETVRRDIEVLVNSNQLKKVRGGATPVKMPLRKDSGYLFRVHHNQQEKMSIGMKAASMIHSGNVVALDSGVSIQAIVSCLHGIHDVTFVTNSLPTALILLDKFSLGEISGRIVLIGGELDVRNRFAKGALAVDELDKYYFDLAFISCTALSVENVSSYSLDECAYSRHLLNRSATTVLIAESEKASKNSVYGFAKISDFDRIITDDKNKLPEDMLKVLSTSKTQLTVAHVHTVQQGDT